jgi:hypothetical protein
MAPFYQRPENALKRAEGICPIRSDLFDLFLDKKFFEIAIVVRMVYLVLK